MSQFDFDHFGKEQGKANKIARRALREIAKVTGRTADDVIRDFKNHDKTVTVSFWLLIDCDYPDKYNRVEYCSGCNKFHLWRQPDRN
ncbi:hypothetical protein T029_25265 [Salmonella enterica subsp. enterica serovar Give]|nr:hypothetical protein [Salmonella enterica subsp. enterica serovar Give]